MEKKQTPVSNADRRRWRRWIARAVQRRRGAGHVATRGRGTDAGWLCWRGTWTGCLTQAQLACSATPGSASPGSDLGGWRHRVGRGGQDEAKRAMGR